MGACYTCYQKASLEVHEDHSQSQSMSWYMNVKGIRWDCVTDHLASTWWLKNPRCEIWTPTWFWCHRFRLVTVVLKALLRHAVHSKQLSTPRSNRFTLYSLMPPPMGYSRIWNGEQGWDNPYKPVYIANMNQLQTNQKSLSKNYLYPYHCFILQWLIITYVDTWSRFQRERSCGSLKYYSSPMSFEFIEGDELLWIKVIKSVLRI